jgi:hypothetical protein
MGQDKRETEVIEVDPKDEEKAREKMEADGQQTHRGKSRGSQSHRHAGKNPNCLRRAKRALCTYVPNA